VYLVFTSEPNYSQYTHEELLDVLEHIDRDKYHHRYQIVLKEIDNRNKGISPKTSSKCKSPISSVKNDDNVVIKAITNLRLNTSRLLKTIFLLGCIFTFLAFVFTPQSEGFGDFVAFIVFLFLSPFLLVYCLHAVKTGEIEIKAITVRRSESPGCFWLGIVTYATFSIFVLFTLIWNTYT